jgi:hypothetical protein
MVELSSELAPSIFTTDWVSNTVKFILAQAIFPWDEETIMNNKIEVLKWLYEFIGIFFETEGAERVKELQTVFEFKLIRL